MKKLIIAMAVALVAAGAMAQDMYWASADASPAIRVKNGYSGNITIVVNSCYSNGSTITVSDGTTTKTITAGGSYNTISEVAAAIAAYTNASLDKLLTVDSTPSLDADVVTNCFYSADQGAETNTISKNQWGTAVKWNTDACLFYSVHVPSSKVGGSGQSAQIQKIYGDIKGTGDITLTGYVENPSTGVMDKKYQKTVTGVVYVYGSCVNGTNVNTTTDYNIPGQIGSSSPFLSGTTVATEWPAPVSGNQSLMIRAARATTATTGGIGVILKK